MTTPNADALSALLSETLREESVSDERVKVMRHDAEQTAAGIEKYGGFHASRSLGLQDERDIAAICTELLALRAQMRWVSVEERLPEYGFPVLAFYPSTGRTNIVKYMPHPAQDYWLLDFDDDTNMNPPEYWAELPPPPAQASTPSSEGV